MHHASDLRMLQHGLLLAFIAAIPFALLPIVHAAHTICSWSPGPLNPDKYNFTMYCEGKAEKMNMTYYTYGCKRTGRELATWGVDTPCGKNGFALHYKPFYLKPSCHQVLWAFCIRPEGATAETVNCKVRRERALRRKVLLLTSLDLLQYMNSWDDCEWNTPLKESDIPGFVDVWSLHK
ncbi:hypothetical protein BDZ90DRAFT_40761 [Jaminaea rosea]|uniref:Uncharacterized protein n=1 Tax=Jaminaea rosea TaxID=1569628 RepID=A0A316UML2_9BASI|nr:hypothetical protein BDZ90DRAFT_40761 [Jaminaea rosea]PWN26532.1 hypothetical protein BDZ90DRAFT_40761 [Jaminaea rosea]